MTWLVTGVAGFLGAATARALLDRGERVVGVDNLDPYTDPHLKLARLERLRDPAFTFTTLDIADEGRTTEVVADVRPTRVLHFAAQPGVRHALRTPVPYARTNLMGTVHVLEAARLTDVEHVVYASSSSVYGETSRTPFSVHDPADHPVSLYAATKRADELLAHSYSHIHGLPTTGLRFFTVYGPWGRPDMAYYAWARAILSGEPVRIFGDGSAERDFTYVDDVVEAVLAVAGQPAAPDPAWSAGSPDPATSTAPFRLYNVGRGRQHRVTEVLDLLERALGRPAHRVHEAAKPGDVPRTHAEVHDLEEAVGVRPRIDLPEGIDRFARWLLDHPEHA